MSQTQTHVLSCSRVVLHVKREKCFTNRVCLKFVHLVLPHQGDLHLPIGGVDVTVMVPVEQELNDVTVHDWLGPKGLDLSGRHQGHVVMREKTHIFLHIKRR